MLNILWIGFAETGPLRISLYTGKGDPIHEKLFPKNILKNFNLHPIQLGLWTASKLKIVSPWSYKVVSENLFPSLVCKPIDSNSYPGEVCTTAIP